MTNLGTDRGRCSECLEVGKKQKEGERLSRAEGQGDEGHVQFLLGTPCLRDDIYGRRGKNQCGMKMQGSQGLGADGERSAGWD